MADHEKPQGPIAIESVPWTEWRQGVRFEIHYRVLSNTRDGGRKIGVSYEELPPGRQSVPFHYHMLEEEHIVALEGEATLRLGQERFRIKAGDYVGFPAGQRAGHCLINDSDAPFRFLMIGDREPKWAGRWTLRPCRRSTGSSRPRSRTRSGQSSWHRPRCRS
jgi:uncharacterized cupin superfamily protein